jgi:isocitrate/isopropylmalate dehydrogenase
MRLAVLPGDDIGPEITEAALTVLDAMDRAFSLGLQYDVHEVGMRAHKRWGTTLPDAALRAVREALLKRLTDLGFAAELTPLPIAVSS